MTAEILIDGGDDEHFDIDMDEANFQAMVNTVANVESEWIRKKAYKNKSLRQFLSSTRFLLEYARHTGVTKKLPPPAWLKFQMTNGFFDVENDQHSFNLKEIVFDKTRHGFGQVDVPFEPVFGVNSAQDLGGCEANCLLRNIYILGNLNHPIVRADPAIFAQNWILTYIRPKFVFRGLIACPKGDYGLMQLIVEITDHSSGKVRSNVSIPFKKSEESRTGQFVPFEVCSPDYDFRPSSIFIFVMSFYVKNTDVPNPGFRMANCTIQCELPDEVIPLSRVGTDSVLTDKQDKPLANGHFFTVVSENETQNQKRLREHFYSVIENAKTIRDEEAARALEEMEEMMGGDLLTERMSNECSEEESVTVGRSEKAKLRRERFEDEQPAVKRSC